MRSLILATATVLISGLLSPSVQAEHYRYSRQTAAPNTGYYVGSGGVGDGPYWQGEPTDRLPIWRYGYYQGNDPDQFIRLQIIRDPTNGPKGRR